MSDADQKIRKPKPTRWLNARDLIDNALVLEMRIGNRDAAWHELSVRYWEDIYGFCLKRVHDKVAAAEARQEAMKRAYVLAAGGRRKDGSYGYRWGSNFRALLFTIARRCCADEGRARSHPTTNVEDLDKKNAVPGILAPGETSLPALRTAARAKKALAGQDPRLVDAVELFFERSHSHEEIAKAMGVTPRQVRSWLEKALGLMRKELGVKGVRELAMNDGRRKKRGSRC